MEQSLLERELKNNKTLKMVKVIRLAFPTAMNLGAVESLPFTAHFVQPLIILHVNDSVLESLFLGAPGAPEKGWSCTEGFVQTHTVFQAMYIIFLCS